MKIFKTASYSKMAKDKAEDFNVNPWAVCHTTVDKDEDPEKYERCVKKVKSKERKKKKAGIDDKKDSKGGYKNYSTDRDIGDVFDDSWNAQTDGTSDKNRTEDINALFNDLFEKQKQKENAGV